MATVATPTVTQRIRRAWAWWGEALRTARTVRQRSRFSTYSLSNVRTNALVRTDVNLAALGRELGVLREGAQLP